MKAIILNKYGGPNVLTYGELERPEPKPGEVLVKVYNVSVNVTLDIKLRQGNYPIKPVFPHVMGIDPVGEIIQVGHGVADSRVGERVAVHALMRSDECIPGHEADDPKFYRFVGIHRWGGYADFVTVPSENAFKIPINLSYPEATVIVRHLPTALHLLSNKGKLKKGEWVLVMGATGGLASCCIQAAKKLGAIVIAGAGADDRVDKAVNYFGADFGINYRQQDLSSEVKRLTEGRGVDVVTDNIGDPDLWSDALDSLASMGRLVTAGSHVGTTGTINLRNLYLGRQTIIGSPGSNFSDVELALEMAKDGSIKAPIIHKIMPLHEAAEAHALVEASNFAGKILLDPIMSTNS